MTRETLTHGLYAHKIIFILIVIKLPFRVVYRDFLAKTKG